MGTKKAKGKSGKTAKKPAKQSEPEKKTKQADIVRVRESINEMVTDSAQVIATELIKVATTGQLASAKYLFEAVGLYPPTEETAAKPKEDALAFRLLRHMGLPTEPVVRDEDQQPVASATPVEETTGEAADAKEVSSGGESEKELGSEETGEQAE